ncbi:MAG: AsmA family protein [Elusimicrobia bacterium]|nr:AsmA family protein [Elusimicrobiota bacterium]
MIRRRGIVGKAVRFLLRLGFRTVGAVLLFLVLGTLAVYLTLRGMMDSEKVKSLIVTQLQEVLHRPVQIEDVLLTPRGVKLKNVRIIERPDVPGHAMLDSDFALITVKLVPLLNGQVSLKNVVLVSPRISIVRSESGEWSVSDIFSSSAAVPLAGFSLRSLAAERSRIEDGLLRIDDRLRKVKYVIEKFNLSVDEFDIGRSFGYALSFDNVNSFGAKDIATSWRVRGMMNLASFDWPKAELIASKLSVSVDGLPIQGSMGVKGFVEPEVDLNLKLPEVARSRWLKYLKHAPDLTLPAGRLRARMRLRLPGRIDMLNLNAEAGILSVAGYGAVDLGGGAPAFAANLDVKEFPLEQAARYTGLLEPYRLEGRAGGKITFTAGPAGFTVHRGSLDWRGARGILGQHGFSGDKVSLVYAEKAAGKPRRASLTVSKGIVGILSDTLTDIDLSAAIQGSDLVVEDLRFKWGFSNGRLKALVRDFASPKKLFVLGSLDRLHWENLSRLAGNFKVAASTAPAPAGGGEVKRQPWVKSLKYSIPEKFPDTVGHVVVDDIVYGDSFAKNFDILWGLGGVSPTLKDIGGDARASFGPGRLMDLPALRKSSVFVDIMLMSFAFQHKMSALSVWSAATADPKTLDFTRIEGEYGFDRGVVSARYFHVDSPQMTGYAEGTMDFYKEAVDMDILHRLNSRRSGQLPEAYMDESGRFALKFKVKGNLNTPDLNFVLNRKLAADEIEKTLAEGKNRAKTRIKAEGDLLKALGKPWWQ